MKPIVALTLLSLPLFVSCVQNYPYQPVAGPEKVENRHASIDVYPDDVRTNLVQYTNLVVAWAGVIRCTEAEDVGPNTIKAVTTIDHHYFDWQEESAPCRKELMLSPRGEGAFKTEWTLRKKNAEATFDDAEKYAAPGKMAIVYGVPEKVDNDNTVVLKYRYLRIVDRNFRTDLYDYGRFGEPFTWIGE